MTVILKKTKNLIVGFFLALLAFSIASGCTKGPEVKPESDERFKKDRYLEAALLFSKKCSYCHGLDVIEASRHRGDEWKNVLDRMFEHDQGNILKETDYAILLDFLEENFR